MPISHVNRRGVTYYLHVRPGKGGKPVYHFAKDAAEGGVHQLPEGYEIYEHPRGQVLLRRPIPSLITDAEREMVVAAIRRNSAARHFRVERGKRDLTVWLGELPDLDWYAEALPGVSRQRLKERFETDRKANYRPLLRFTLSQQDPRTFRAERWCFRGSVDGWISLHQETDLNSQAEAFCRHLGRDTFYELF